MTEEFKKCSDAIDWNAADAAEKTAGQAAAVLELDDAAKAAAAREARRQALYEENERAEDERARAEAERMRDVDDEDEDEMEDDDFDEDLDEMYETTCPTCGNTIRFDYDQAAKGEIDCPNCGAALKFSLDDEDDAE